MLSQETIQELNDLSCRYDVWLQAAMDDFDEQDKVYGEEFFKEAEMQR